MKFLSILLLTVFITWCGVSCKKESTYVRPSPLAALTVVNAVVNANPVIADFSGADSVKAYFATTTQIGYGSFYEYSVSGSKSAATIYQVSDTLEPFYKGIVNLQPYGVYSLFLSGADTNHVDTLLTLDNPPYHPNTDSTCGVRFINLSAGSQPLSVNLVDNGNGSEAGNLAYRAITGFKNYYAGLNATAYTFEIRDAASGNLLATWSNNLSIYQNITIAVIGLQDSAATVPISVMQINNF